MNELDAILRTYRSGAGNAVLATVVHVEGSAYRRPGARMLLCEDGTRVGSISGGCLEGDLARKAWWWTSSGDPLVRVYDTSSDDDAVWEFGLGCNGVIHVLLERMETAREVLRHLDTWRSAQRAGVIATVIAGDLAVGARLFIGADLAREGNLLNSCIETAVADEAVTVFQQRVSRLLHLPQADVFLEWAGPPQRVIVFGAGHDAIPLVSMASTLGWHVTIADGRPAYAKVSRFPGADNVTLLPPSSDVCGLGIDSDTAVVLMTHNFPLDVRLLRQILPLQPRYVGLLGPIRRTERLFDELNEDRHNVDLHAPVGLDVGGDSPECVALSIVAEIQAAIHRRSGRMLRYRRGAIHPPASESSGGSAFDRSHAVNAALCELRG